MAIASGLLKVTSWKKQTGLGVASSGASGKTARRTSSVFKAQKDTFESNEIVSHHQSTGVAYGLQKADGKIDGLLSSGTFSDFIASILEKDFAAGATLAAQSITYGGTTPNWTMTGTGFMVGSVFKTGDVIRASGGSVTGNNARNFLITALTNTLVTFRALDGATVTAGVSTTTALAAVGKKTYAPTTGHTKDYYTIEEWYSDLSKSETFTDMRVGAVSISLPATGNATISTDFVGLNRTLAGAQVLTSPTTTSTSIMAASNGAVYINGVLQTGITSLSVNISNSAANAGAVVGSDVGFDVTTGRIKVTGSFSAQFDSTTLQALYAAETAVSLMVCVTGDNTATSDFITITLPKIKMTDDAPDDGEKAIVRTYPFTAEYNSAGGAGVSAEQSICVVQDSAA